MVVSTEEQRTEAAGAVYKRTCLWVNPDGNRSTGAIGRASGTRRRTGHQTQKQLALMEMLVRLFSDKDEVILDPFAGSGTTGVAAIRLGRRFAGWLAQQPDGTTSPIAP